MLWPFSIDRFYILIEIRFSFKICILKLRTKIIDKFFELHRLNFNWIINVVIHECISAARRTYLNRILDIKLYDCYSNYIYHLKVNEHKYY